MIKLLSVQLLTLLLLLITPSLLAQSSVNANGEILISDFGSVQYSIGEISVSDLDFADAIQAATISTTIQDISTTTPVSNVSILDAKIDVYPNPAHNMIMLDADDLQDYNYSLIDSQGQVKTIGLSKSFQTVIPIDEYQAGIYFIRIFKGSNQKTYTISIINK